MVLNDCQCASCTSACKNTPGWFMPGEAEKAAEYMGLPLKELFDLALVANWWEAEEDIFVISPAVVNGPAGEEAAADPRGTCVFFLDNKCSIHEVKPFECRQFHHSDSHDAVDTRHESVAMAWKSEQKQIKELLGHEPESKSFNSGSGFSLFSSIFGSHYD